ncbi:MAG: hypothetical protein J5965_27775 [Aeriscardovia sp.]|nr:hypothetical protein [Aeriscardovia sp.]
MGKRIDHTGETNTSTNGMKMTIIRYGSSNDIDVLFEDGSMVTHKQYAHFRTGKITTKSLYSSNRIGETRLMNCGHTATIIEYITSHDITVKFDDGIIVTKKYYRDFVWGQIKHPEVPMEAPIKRNRPTHEQLSEWSKKGHEIQLKKSQEKHQGEEGYNKNGQKMKIVAYRKWSDIDVLFEDGTLVKGQRYEKFKNGTIVNPNNKIIAHTSINEYTMLYYLSKIGFKKAPAGSLKHLGFGRMELDAYNESNKIAVEYDGAVHGFRHNTDVKKDTCCHKNGIELIRIRDNLDSVSSMSHSMKLSNCTPFSNEYEELLVRLCNHLTSLGLPYVSVDFERDKRKIADMYEAEYKNGHIGEIYYDSYGEKAEIIRYISSTDVIVRFQDGTEKQCNYDKLKTGQFRKSGYFVPPSSRIGEKRHMICGMIATLIHYNSCSDVDIMFEDGTVVKHKRYDAFTSGKIGNPTMDKTKTHRLERLHQKKEMRNGLIAEIIEYNNSSNVVVLFSNGETRRCHYTQFARGTLTAPSQSIYKARDELCAKKHIGSEKLMKCGMMAKIIAYRSYRDIDVMFEDGLIRYNVSCQAFNSGKLTRKETA